MSAIPENGLMLAEKRANAKRGLIYTAALAFVIVIGLAVSHMVFAAIAWERGLAEGQRREAAKWQVVSAPTNCRDLARICANQQIDRWKRK